MMGLIRTASLLALAAAASAGEKTTLADLLPPDTPVYMDVLSPTQEEIAKLAYYRCLQDPALKKLLEGLGKGGQMTTMETNIGPGRVAMKANMADSEFPLEIVYQDKKGRRSFQIRTHMGAALAGFRGDPNLPIDAVIAFKVKEDADGALVTLKRIASALVLSMQNLPMGDVDVTVGQLFQEVSYREKKYTVANLGDVQLYLAAIDKMVLLATDEGRIRDIWDRHLDKRADSLAQAPRHVAALRSGPGTKTLTVAVQVDNLILKAKSLFGPKVDEFQAGMEAMGLDSLEGLVISSQVDGSGFSSRMSLLFKEGPRRGLGKLFEGGEPISFKTLDFAPANTLYVASSGFEPGEIWDSLKSIPGSDLQAMEDRFKLQSGIDLRNDLFGQIGPEAGLIVSSNRGLIPDIGLVFSVRDGGKVQKILLQLAQQAMPGGGPQKARIGGVDAHVIPLMTEHGGVPVAPTIGVIDGQMLITPFPMSFQRFAAVKRGDRPSIRDNRDFATLKTRIPKDALGMSYMDLRRVVGALYDTFMPIVQAMPQQPGASHVYELPEADQITKYLYGTIGWRTVDKRGMHWHTHSSIDTATLYLVEAGIVAGIGMALVGRTSYADAEPQQVMIQEVGPDGRPVDPMVADPRFSVVVRDRSNLIFLRGEIANYRREHNKLPEDLSVIQKRAEYLPPETFLVPGTDEAYVYLGDQPGPVLIYGHANGKDRKITVLLRKGGVARVTAEGLDRLLKSRREAK